MILKEARDHYLRHTTTLSEVNRQLCFAGVAVVWIFAKGSEGVYTLPPGLVFPLGCFVLGLGLDLCQYFVASASWGLYSRHKERSGIASNQDFGAPRVINWVPLVFFWLKPIATFVGFFCLLRFLFPYLGLIPIY